MQAYFPTPEVKEFTKTEKEKNFNSATTVMIFNKYLFLAFSKNREYQSNQVCLILLTLFQEGTISATRTFSVTLAGGQ